MISLLFIAFRNQWLAQIKKPLEFLLSIFVLVLNNSSYLYGIYLLASISSDQNALANKEYLISTGMVLTSWGLLNVFGGGLFQLGSYIESGELECYLAKPRSPLLLVSLSKSHLMSFGEIIQGALTIIYSSIIYGPILGLRMLFISLIMVFVFASVVIIIGTFSFFSTRGSQISYVISQVFLSLSLFPVDRALSGREKWLLYFTPIILTATLPRLIVSDNEFYLMKEFIILVLALMLLSILFFRIGLRKFKTKNYIFING
jgi:ABC-2 type transport system permease protein